MVRVTHFITLSKNINIYFAVVVVLSDSKMKATFRTAEKVKI